MSYLARKLRLSPTARCMCISILWMFVGLLIVGILVGRLVYPFEQALPYTVGLLLGCLLSLGKVVLLQKGFEHVLDLEGRITQVVAVLQVFARYVLTAAVLVTALLLPAYIGFIGAISGILTLQVAGYIAGHRMGRRDKQPKSGSQKL